MTGSELIEKIKEIGEDKEVVISDNGELSYFQVESDFYGPDQDASVGFIKLTVGE